MKKKSTRKPYTYKFGLFKITIADDVVRIRQGVIKTDVISLPNIASVQAKLWHLVIRTNDGKTYRYKVSSPGRIRDEIVSRLGVK